MYIDIFILAFVAIMLFRGIFTGAFIHLYRILAMIGAIFIAHYTAPQVAEFINNSVGISLSTCYSSAAFIIWLASSFILSKILYWLLNPILDKLFSGTNKVLGGIVGLGNGLLIAYLLLWLVLLADNHFPNWALLQKIEPHNSVTFNMVKKNNFIQKIDFNMLPKLQEVTKMAQDQATSLPQELQNNPSFKKLISAPDLSESLKKGDLTKLLNDSRIREALSDPDLQKQLKNINIPKGDK